MKFFTEVDIPESLSKIDHQTGAMMIGSCFTENIGNKLAELKYNIDINPFGILYNPASVINSIQYLIEKKKFTSENLFNDRGIWNSFAHHSRFSGTNQEHVLSGMNDRIEKSHLFLKNAEYLIITLGTSWVYELIENKQIVSNCHKVPANNFRRFRLRQDEIAGNFKDALTDLLRFNSKLRIIFTVSPIRHWKDGAIENQRSKAILLLAIDELIKFFGKEKCNYFPSYEIVMDELRDYRYYADDMLHLSETAINHIYDKFCKIMISKDSLKLSKDVLKVIKAARHRPLNYATVEYRNFLLYNLHLIDEITKKFPFLNFNNEKSHFQDEINRHYSG